MKLYSIRHKHSKKTLVNVHPITGAYWSATPNYWKTPDGISKQLKRLCGEKKVYDWDGWIDAEERSHGYGTYWINFDLTKLADIEVVITNVALLGEEQYAPEHFIKTDEECIN